jgi:hypothetical protein
VFYTISDYLKKFNFCPYNESRTPKRRGDKHPFYRGFEQSGITDYDVGVGWKRNTLFA